MNTSDSEHVLGNLFHSGLTEIDWHTDFTYPGIMKKLLKTPIGHQHLLHNWYHRATVTLPKIRVGQTWI